MSLIIKLYQDEMERIVECEDFIITGEQDFNEDINLHINQMCEHKEMFLSKYFIPNERLQSLLVEHEKKEGFLLRSDEKKIVGARLPKNSHNEFKTVTFNEIIAIPFTKGKPRRSYIFNDVAYICNENGKTIKTVQRCNRLKDAKQTGE